MSKDSHRIHRESKKKRVQKASGSFRGFFQRISGAFQGRVQSGFVGVYGLRGLRGLQGPFEGRFREGEALKSLQTTSQRVSQAFQRDSGGFRNVLWEFRLSRGNWSIWNDSLIPRGTLGIATGFPNGFFHGSFQKFQQAYIRALREFFPGLFTDFFGNVFGDSFSNSH